MTQKEMLATVRDYAADLGFKATIRREPISGQFIARLIPEGNRNDAEIYAADSFAQAVEILNGELVQIEVEQRREGNRRAKAYAEELQTALDQAQTILALVGCRLEVDAQDTVTMYSPKTGSHSLSMRLGVRPVSDLMAHVCGFAEQQTHVRTVAAPSQVLADEQPGFYVAGRKVEPGDTILDFRGEPWRFVRITRLPEIGKSGKVFMAAKHGSNGVYSQEFYPSVFDGIIK